MHISAKFLMSQDIVRFEGFVDGIKWTLSRKPYGNLRKHYAIVKQSDTVIRKFNNFFFFFFFFFFFRPGIIIDSEPLAHYAPRKNSTSPV